VSALILHRVDELRAHAEAARRAGRRVGVVLTMGALHEGHLSLVEHAARIADEIILTVFVNPTQFGPNEDLAKYPRTLERDIELATKAGATCVFAPDAKEMYPGADATRVVVSKVSEPLCGRFRPGHFAGVATVVTKFFAILGPSVALFGRKDYQQLQVIRTLVSDLLLPIEVIGLPTVRDADGLARSSRNVYLSSEERQRALAIPRALSRAFEVFTGGERDRAKILELVSEELRKGNLDVQYAELLDADDLSSFPTETLPDRALLAIAAYCGSTRLIDNIVLGEDPSPIGLP
jgi:pantoate--beta-alanine ligase